MSEPDSDPQALPVPRRSAAGRAFRSALISGAVGLLVVLGSLLVAVETGSTTWSISNVSWIIFGAATGAVFGPLFTLARDDGDDDAIVRDEQAETGRADATIEGAQAYDLRRREQAGVPPDAR